MVGGLEATVGSMSSIGLMVEAAVGEGPVRTSFDGIAATYTAKPLRGPGRVTCNYLSIMSAGVPVQR
jgi:hypothetical protein